MSIIGRKRKVVLCADDVAQFCKSLWNAEPFSVGSHRDESGVCGQLSSRFLGENTENGRMYMYRYWNTNRDNVQELTLQLFSECKDAGSLEERIYSTM